MTQTTGLFGGPSTDNRNDATNFMLVPGVIGTSVDEGGKSFTITVFPLTNTCPISSSVISPASIDGLPPQRALLPKVA